ncbi:MAG: type III-B CRISPR module-associated protein Cmr5 [Candidatus Nitrosocaldaceae archaeon]
MSDSERYSTITIAIKCIEEVRKFDEKIDKFGKSYRSRARRIPSLIYEIGLVSTICYLYAKATSNVYEKILNSQNQGTCIINVQASNEELAHALYLKHLLSYISGKIGRGGEEKYPIKFVNTLAENPNDIIVAESLLKPFLIELKHLAEAILEVEE